MPDLRILVVYYSRSGTTRIIAESLSKAFKCDVEEIVEVEDRVGFFGYVRSLVEAMRKRPSAIARGKGDPSSYDLIIIGKPVWAWSVSSPVRAYLMANKECLPQVAFFCTLGGRGSESAFTQMQYLVGKDPRARCSFATGEVIAGSYGLRLAAFVKALEPSVSA